MEKREKEGGKSMNEKIMVDYSMFKSGEKFIAIAKKNKELFTKHIEEYKKQYFLDDKLRELEKALEYAILAIEYYEEAFRAREDRQNLYKELENLFKNEAGERTKVIMYLACKESPAKPVSLTHIAKEVYGDKYKDKHKTVSEAVNALERFGIVSTRKEGNERLVVMKEEWRRIFVNWLQDALILAGKYLKGDES